MANEPVNDPGMDPGAAPSAPAGDPGTGNPNPGDTPAATPDPRDEQIKQLREQVRASQQAVLDSRRKGSQTPGAEGEDPFSTPEGRYAAALEMATARLLTDMEKIYSLYPEIPPEDLSRIRANPWAFASRDTFMRGDWETAKLEIEQSLADRVEALETAKKTPQPTPASINPNPAPEPGNPGAPGSGEEGEDPWTMPMDKLEKLAMKEKAKLDQKS